MKNYPNKDFLIHKTYLWKWIFQRFAIIKYEVIKIDKKGYLTFITMVRLEPKVSCSRFWVRLVLNHQTKDKLYNECKNTKYKVNIIQTCRPKYHILLGNILGADRKTIGFIKTLRKTTAGIVLKIFYLE